MSGYLDGLHGPTRRELRAIDAEWPVIAAELADLDRLIGHLLDAPAVPAARRPAAQNPAGYPAAA